MSEQQVPVPIAATLVVTQRQRNSLADENAVLWALVEELKAERDQARAKLAELCAVAPVN